MFFGVFYRDNIWELVDEVLDENYFLLVLVWYQIVDLTLNYLSYFLFRVYDEVKVYVAVYSIDFYCIIDVILIEQYLIDVLLLNELNFFLIVCEFIQRHLLVLLSQNKNVSINLLYEVYIGKLVVGELKKF